MGQYINSQNVLDIIAKHYVQAMHEIYELVDVTSEKEKQGEKGQNKIDIGANIRAIRKAKGITQAELAEMTGCGIQSNIGQIERKKIGIRMTTIVKIADALGVSVDELLTYKETEKGFGAKLLTVCKENGITIKEVSEGTGIPKNTLYNITKRDTKYPQNGIQEKVVNYLETRIPNITEEEKAQMRWLLLP